MHESIYQTYARLEKSRQQGKTKLAETIADSKQESQDAITRSQELRNYTETRERLLLTISEYKINIAHEENWIRSTKVSRGRESANNSNDEGQKQRYIKLTEEIERLTQKLANDKQSLVNAERTLELLTDPRNT